MTVTPVESLWAQANGCLQARRSDEAVCYLAEIVGAVPQDRKARLTLALALGNAGNPAGALAIMRIMADRLVHDGFLLPAMVVIHRGLHNSGGDQSLLQCLQRLHVHGVHARAGTLALPPPLEARSVQGEPMTAAALLAMPLPQRLEHVARVGAEFPPAGPVAVPQPMPLFCELGTDVFVETVRLLQYRRVAAGTQIIAEGAPGDSLLILVSGQVAISKAGTEICRLGQGSVLGEMSLITHAPRSATAIAAEEVEYFELGRNEVAELSKREPRVLQELAQYCRGRLLINLLRTSPLFTPFDEATRMRLLERFKTITIADGEPALMHGERPQGLFVVATGTVEVHVVNAEGDRAVVATLGPGHVFGEISLLRGHTATADVFAKGTVGALVLPAEDFALVLQQFPQVHQYLENLTADRLKASQDAAVEAGLADPDDVVVL